MKCIRHKISSIRNSFSDHIKKQIGRYGFDVSQDIIERKVVQQVEQPVCAQIYIKH